jgi:peptide/nickel transport system permease protein
VAREFLRLAWATKTGRIGLPLVAIHLILALVGTLLAPYSPTDFNSLPIEGRAAVEKAGSDADFSTFLTSGILPENPNKRALVQFYRSQASAGGASGSYDVDRARANVATLELEWTDGQKAYVDNQRKQIRQLEGPSLTFWLGTDQFGRDVLSRVMSGATSLIGISLAGAVLGVAAGMAIGMSSAYKGGKTDDFVMRVMDGMMSFPTLLLALLVLATLGSRSAPFEWIDSLWDETLVVLTIAVVNIPRVSRVMRSVTLVVKEMEFVQNARLRGESSIYIVFREILPNTIPTLAVEMSVRFSYAVLLVSSLGFLGMGVQPPSPDWGLMISQSRQFLYSAPWAALAPVVAVATLVVGVNLLADGIKQARGLPQMESV